MKELQLSELTMEQKIGMMLCATLPFHGEEDVEFALQLIRERKLGGVYIGLTFGQRKKTVQRVLEAADYPILVMCDAERGYPGYFIPQTISLSAAGENEEYAYSFGRVTATLCRQDGYNIMNSPNVDFCGSNFPCGTTSRILSPKTDVTCRLAAAMARGMRDGGILPSAKHYPSPRQNKRYDSHMREGFATDTLEDIKRDSLVAYRYLHDAGLLDSIMVGHKLMPNIDPDRPASLSKPVMDIFREEGYDGLYVSDSLGMMGVVLKYGYIPPIPMSVIAGCDLALPWTVHCREAYEALLAAWRDGSLSEERINEAARRVLEAQHKAAMLPKAAELRQEDLDNIKRINEECISARCAEGLSPAISKDGKHLFVIMTDGKEELDQQEYDIFSASWYSAHRIADKIRATFPNSATFGLPQYPTAQQNFALFTEQTKYDDVVFITYTNSEAFAGREHLTSRFVDMMDALQSTDKVIAHLHFGNPFVATDAPYVPRVIMGWANGDCIIHALDILAGDAPALGTQPYEELLHFHEKGYEFD